MVYMDQKVFDKVIHYAQSAYDQFQSEIGGMMVVVEDEDGDWQCLDPQILKQEISASNCHLDRAELSRYYTRMAMKYKKYKNFRFCWWHSHHTMAAFWSSTDLSTIEEGSEGDISFSLVVNLKKEYKFRVNMWQPVEMHKDIELTFINGKEKKVPKKINDEVEKLCSKEVTIGYTGWQGNVNQGNFWGQRKEPAEKDIFSILSSVKNADTIECMESIIATFVAGEMDYKGYCEELKLLNKELKDRKAGWHFKRLGNNQLFDDCLHLTATDLVVIHKEEKNGSKHSLTSYPF